MSRGSSFEIRPEQQPDAEAVRRVVTAAFGVTGEKVADLVRALKVTDHARLSLVAEVNGAVVGHVLLSRSWVDARQRLVEVLVLSPLSVLPQSQGRGIGTELVAAAVIAAGREGVPALFLEGSPDYYGARGFARADGQGFSRPSARIPAAAFQVVTYDSREDWMRGPLVYCDPFWVHDGVGLRDPELAELEERFG